MANFPCSKCKAMVSTSRVDGGICKKCGNKKPFVCAKCNKAMGLNDIFNLSDVSISNQPIYCDDCGSNRELIKCGVCGVKLIRSTGIEREVNGVKKVCHQKCLDKNAKMFKIMLPILSLLCAILIGYVGYRVEVWRYDSAIDVVEKQIEEIQKKSDEAAKDLKPSGFEKWKNERARAIGEKNNEIEKLKQGYKSDVVIFILGGMLLGVATGVTGAYKLFELR